MKDIAMKKTLNPRLFLMAVAMTASIVSQAFAATPRSESVISGDTVTLADVFDGVEKNAGYVLAPAPDFGKTLTLNAHDLNRIAEAFNLDWSPAGAPQQVVIRRAFDEVSAARVKSGIVEKLASTLPGQRLDVELDDPAFTLRVANADSLSVDLTRIDAARGTFTATLSAEGASRAVSGRFFSVIALPVLKAPLRAGDIITASDIEHVDMRATDITSAMVVDPAKAIGMTPRRGIAALKPILLGDIQAPTLVKKGDLVTMTLKNEMLLLTAQGRALSGGAAGDVVKVLNTSSNQTVDAVITGPQSVSVRAATSTL